MDAELKYEELFNENDVLSISRDDFNLIMEGNNRFLNIVDNKDENNVCADIYNSLKGMRFEYFYNDNAIVYIKAKNTLTLEMQAKIIDEIRKNFYVELNIIYGVSLSDEIKSNMIIYILSSKSDKSVA